MIIIIIIIMAVFLRVWLPHRGMAQVACSLILPHDDNILNKYIIWKEERCVSNRELFIEKCNLC